MATMVIKDSGKRILPFDEKRLISYLTKLFDGLDIKKEFMDEYINKTVRQVSSRSEIDFREINEIAKNNALELILEVRNDSGEVDLELLANSQFNLVAKRVLLNSIYKRASKNRSYNPALKYGDFFGLISTLAEKGLIHTNLLEDYSVEEIVEAGSYIQSDRDQLLPYAGLYHMSERYIVRDRDENRSIYELPQERYMVISLAVNRKENKESRMKHVLDLYNRLSGLEATMATPTFSNAGLPDGQLSSCFVLTTEDSLRSIYDDNTDIATLSKNGGGIGKPINADLKLCEPVKTGCAA